MPACPASNRMKAVSSFERSSCFLALLLLSGLFLCGGGESPALSAARRVFHCSCWVSRTYFAQRSGSVT